MTRPRSNEPTEREFQDAVVDLARFFRWRVAHFRPARTAKGWRTAMTGDAGWPDLVLVKPPRLLVRELKAARGRVSPEQEAWLADLRACGADAGVWTPADWPEIEEALAGRRMT